jgi:hypothetical protein
MRQMLWLGVTFAMMACTTQKPEMPGEISYATHGDKVQPSPLQIPAEIDPPPVPAPGSEGPGLEPGPQPSDPHSPDDTPTHP